jgi:Eukaryotic porin
VGILSFAIRLGQIPNMLQATHLTNFIFDGARADLMKGLSMDPAFQVTHSFQLASQSVPPTYTFGALFANPKVSDGIPVHMMLFLTLL